MPPIYSFRVDAPQDCEGRSCCCSHETMACGWFRQTLNLSIAARQAAQRIWSSPLPDGAGTQIVLADGWAFHPLIGARGRVGLLAVANVSNGRELADPEQPGLRTPRQ
jgi:hypothetical protein